MFVSQSYLEPLEDRRLLSASLSDAGLLRVSGSDGVNDSITVRFSADGQNLTVTVNGQNQGNFDKDDVKNIQIKGKGGNDTLRLNHDRGNIKVRTTMIGGDGNDKLVSGNEAVNDLRGGNGDDFIDGRGVLRGGEGDDEFDGSNFKDYIFGDAGRDSLDAEGGNDALFGGDGNDTVEGGRGNDTCFGGNGDDRVEGGRGDDLLLGNAGIDSVFGDDNDDTLFGGDDDDIVNGNEGDDQENDDESPDALALEQELTDKAENA